MKKIKLVAMAVMCFVVTVANAQVVNDSVKQKESVVFEGTDTMLVVVSNKDNGVTVGRFNIRKQNTKNMSVQELQKNLSDEVKI